MPKVRLNRKLVRYLTCPSVWQGRWRLIQLEIAEA